MKKIITALSSALLLSACGEDSATQPKEQAAVEYSYSSSTLVIKYSSNENRNNNSSSSVRPSSSVTNNTSSSNSPQFSSSSLYEPAQYSSEAPSSQSSSSINKICIKDIDCDIGDDLSCNTEGKIVEGKDYPSNRYYCTKNGQWVSLTDGWSWDVPKEVRCDRPVTYGTLTDTRESPAKTYKTVKIGSQTWMAENLNYKVNDQKSSWCYGNNPANCEITGRLYTWNAAVGRNEEDCEDDKTCGITEPVKGICPNGWHMPSKSEWEVLVDYTNSTAPANILKSQTGWGWTFRGKHYGGSDDYGFCIIPGSRKYYNYSQAPSLNDTTIFDHDGFALFWTSTLYYGNIAYYATASYDDVIVFPYDFIYYGMSVRCIKD